jgi:hypothetical protein
LPAEVVFALRISKSGFALQSEAEMSERLGAGKSFPCPEIGTGTARLSTFEDLMKRTLNAVQGMWRKLDYLAELRKGDGEYEHWGLSRVHGEVEAGRILAETHSSLYMQLLRTPIEELAADLEFDDDDESAAVLVQRIAIRRKQMIPSFAPGAAPRHFNSVVLAVSLLCSEQRAANHPVA